MLTQYEAYLSMCADYLSVIIFADYLSVIILVCAALTNLNDILICKFPAIDWAVNVSRLLHMELRINCTCI